MKSSVVETLSYAVLCPVKIDFLSLRALSYAVFIRFDERKLFCKTVLLLFSSL